MKYRNVLWLQIICLSILAMISGCGKSTDPSVNKIRLDINDKIKKDSNGIFQVDTIEIVKTDRPAEDRIFYRVITMIRPSSPEKREALSLLSSNYTPINTTTFLTAQFIMAFFAKYRINDIEKLLPFLKGDQDTQKLILTADYTMKTKDVWTLDFLH